VWTVGNLRNVSSLLVCCARLELFQTSLAWQQEHKAREEGGLVKTLKLAEQFPLLTKGSQICDQEHEAHEEGGLVAFWQSAPGGAGDLESGIATPRQVSDDDEWCTKCNWSAELFSSSLRAVVHHIVTSLGNHEDRE